MTAILDIQDATVEYSTRGSLVRALDGATLRGLHQVVRIGERHAQDPSQPPAGGRLARPRQPDQQDARTHDTPCRGHLAREARA